LVGCCVGPKRALPWPVGCATILFLLYDAQSASEEAFLEQFARAFFGEKELQRWIWIKIGGRLFSMNI
jgi:hypothetical protein